MSDGDIFWDYLSDPRTLNRAAHLVDKDSKADFYDAVIERQIATHRRGTMIDDIKSSLRSDRYMPSPTTSILVPKSTYSQRPGTILPYRDRIVLQSIVMCMAPQLDVHLSSSVWSWRVRKNLRGATPDKITSRGIFEETDIAAFPYLKKKTVDRYISTFEPWYGLWPKFDVATKSALKSTRYSYMVISDISGYFENIQLSVLHSLLSRYVPHAPRTINLLLRHLRSWQTFTHHGLQVDRGIPQGNSISSFLGNFYLKPVDDFFDGYPEPDSIKYFRYMDDIRILAKDHITARRVALALESQIRKAKLNLQTAKTAILPSAEALSMISDSRLALLDSVGSMIRRNDKVSANKALAAIARHPGDSNNARKLHLSKPPVKDLNLRVLRRWASYHEQLGNRTAVNRLARELLANPNYVVTRDFQRTGRHFPGLVREPKRLWDALVADEILFPYQRAEVLIALRQFGWYPDNAVEYCRQVCLDENADPYVRLQCAIFFARLPSRQASAAFISRQCLNSADTRVIMAGLVIASTGSPVELKECMQAAYTHSSVEATHFVQYIRAIRNENAPRRQIIDFVLGGKDPVQSRLFDYAVFLRCIASGSHVGANDLHSACSRARKGRGLTKGYKSLLDYLMEECVSGMAATPSVSGAIV